MQLAMLGALGGTTVSPGAPNTPSVDLSGAVAPTPGTAPKPAGPKAEVHIGGSTASVPVSNADRVFAGMRARFRQCYQTGLAVDPTMSGKLVITLRVGPNGDVLSVSVASNTGLSPAVATCVANAAKRAQFDPPGGGGATLSVPATYVSSK